ncbi:phosphoglycerate kinase [Candidatus Giovannonibacteria bacterium RIFCSPHIGHO2_02_FULL_46_20]|uniref:Phosphoglycerate kinase n=1 Tax=Candidatus Giovannonibacteria bacterium RIFCSPHIGHO2_02_FULL_46_20 TaxID=1798338 RepID=A0A1F5WFU8_9BACT|nr:MAG: phosphoglycerate kinase [Candidatus Giovannonibacteria bacterium RIFCSPHIGHO2_02_FULL_46_20]
MILRHLRGKRVLLRVDFNYPFEHRIAATIPTIQALLARGARVVLISHLDTEGASLIAAEHHISARKAFHLDFAAKALKKRFKDLVYICGRIRRPPRDFFSKHPARLFLLDNLRLDPGEEHNDARYARTLASWGDYYINEAFSVSHRKHASVVGIPRLLPSSFGGVMRREIQQLSRLFHPKHPFLVVVGGKKYSTKEPLVNAFLKNADAIFLGGVLANTFLQQRGFMVGRSEIDRHPIPRSVLWHKKIVLPKDVLVRHRGARKHIAVDEIQSTDTICDIGPHTEDALRRMTKNARTILWNGTLGVCEKGFCDGTRHLAKAVGKSKAHAVAGGGDTVAAIRALKLEKNFNFISTGGGAMLEFLAKCTLPGIAAIEAKKSGSHVF